MEEILHYFPSLTIEQKAQFEALKPVYQQWNAQINVVSRKNIDALYINHVLHSLAIAKFIGFKPTTSVLDIGTGGGFPGIPLAILFPESKFTLVDSIAKKIKVVNEVISTIGLQNCTALHTRAEKVQGKFDFVVSRAVAPASKLIAWSRLNLKAVSVNEMPNGFIFLKGGDLQEELSVLKQQTVEKPICHYFSETFFETKKIIYIPMQPKR